jgi:hypothetical protein
MKQVRAVMASKNAQAELKGKMLVLKQLEGVYRTSTDPEQCRRVAKEIKEIKQVISNLQSILSIQQKYGLARDVDVSEGEESYRILGRIRVINFVEGSRDTEIDAITSYVDYFEKNYLPVLSEYYIKLDYNHSMKRDTFYPRFMEIKKILKEYSYELEIQNREEFNTIALHKDKSIVYKLRQQYLLYLDKYFKELKEFVEELLNDHSSGGSIVLNPLEIINMSEFEVDRKLDEYTVINAIVEMCMYFGEIIRFLAMPNI